MNRIDEETIIDLRPYFPNGGRFTSGGIRDLIAKHEKIDPGKLNMAGVFAAIAALHQQQGEVQVDGGEYIFTPLSKPPVTMACFNW